MKDHIPQSITFAEWRRRFPELVGKYEVCDRCDGEGRRLLDDDKTIWTCPKCEGEGQICQDRVRYREHVRLTLEKYRQWVEGKPLLAGPAFERLTIPGDVDWGNVMREGAEA